MGSEQKVLMEEALLQQPAANQQAAPPHEREDGHGTSMLTTVLGFLFLTFNSGMAVYMYNRDLGAMAFVAFSFLDLLMLFHCLRLYERAPPGSPRREDLKMAVWLLTTMLTWAFLALLGFWARNSAMDFLTESHAMLDPNNPNHQYLPPVP